MSAYVWSAIDESGLMFCAPDGFEKPFVAIRLLPGGYALSSDESHSIIRSFRSAREALHAGERYLEERGVRP